MKVTIDPYSGFCFGVQNAIEMAENALKQNPTIYCIGEIIHNADEINRLESKGLKTIHYDDIEKLKSENVLIRAHGEPPCTYEKAKKNNIRIIDGTCPIVLKLQEKISKAYEEMKEVGGQIIIYGKNEHPEVIGLVGHTENNAIVINDISELFKIDFMKPIRLFAQTTKSKEEYLKLIEIISNKLTTLNPARKNFKFYNTICGQVSNRVPELKEFCKNFDMIIFLSGKNSSNGKFLYGICKNENTNSYFISSLNELDKKWFTNANNIGITGATSTPYWVMEQVAQKIKGF